jgi:hypothetical protein
MQHPKTDPSTVSHQQRLERADKFLAEDDRMYGKSEPLTPEEQDELETAFRYSLRMRRSNPALET